MKKLGDSIFIDVFGEKQRLYYKNSDLLNQTSKMHEFTLEKQKFTKDDKENKKIAMFCTGGIRCEKASSFMKENGFKNVNHLKGGILNYFKSVNKMT